MKITAAGFSYFGNAGGFLYIENSKKILETCPIGHGKENL